MVRESDLELYHETTVLLNNGDPVDSDWSHQADGTLFLDQNMTSKKCVYTLPSLNVGDKITGFRIVGAIGATTGNSTIVDADLRKVTKGAGAVTDASVGTITQVSVVADTALDSAKTGLSEEVVTDYQYYVLVTATTKNNAANDLKITGIEVDVKKKFGESA